MTARSLPLIAILLIGCGPKESDEDNSGPPKPAAVSFTGNVDPKLVGVWKTDPVDSTLDLGKDGSLKIESVTSGPGGKSISKNEGEWRADGPKLVLQYSQADGSKQTISYAMKVTGNTMTLSTKVPKRDTVYTRH